MSMNRFRLVALMGVIGAGTVRAEDTASSEIGWDVASLCQVVQPMRNPLHERLPLMLWNFPLPRNDDLMKMRASGELRRDIDLMAERGLVPTVEMGWAWTLEGALAMARTLQEAKAPVNVLIPQADMIEATVYEGCTVWSEGPDATRNNQNRKWPCLPLANTKAGADEVRRRLSPFKEAGIPVRGAWFDDECLPHPWNGCYESQRDSAACKTHYPPSVLDDFSRFNEYAYGLRSKFLLEVMAAPARELFPGAIVGNYSEFASSKEVPFEGVRPPRRVDGLVLMPAAYANTVDLSRHFGKDERVTQARADRIYFHNLLRSVSTCNANKQLGQLSIPYLSRFTPDNPDPRFLFGMTSARFRELARHVWMRGTDGMYVFNLGFPAKPQFVTPAASFESIEDIRAALDELLDRREFLEKGRPMNFAVPKLEEEMAIWSGLELGDRCLVRAFTFAPGPVTFELKAFDGKSVRLEARPEGVTYIVNRDGKAERLGK